MAPSQNTPGPPYEPLPLDLHEPDYIVLPVCIPIALRRRWRCRLICASSILLLAAAGCLILPSDPDLKVVRLRLQRVHIRTFPRIFLDIKIDVTVKVHNRNVYSLDYRSLLVAITYRGRQLGFATSDHGHVRARVSSYVNATLELNGVEILFDVLFLLEDLARGSIPFDTVTEVRGQLGLFFFEFPLEAKMSCGVDVNIRNQTIVRQDCYPD